VLAQLPARGVRRVVVTTPGFLADGLETIEEIGVKGRETFLHAGGEVFVRASGAEDHPAMIETLLAAALRA
jgi:ferrochelatase